MRRRRTKPIEHMPERQDGMAPDHAGTGDLHNDLHFLPMDRRIAVNRAMRAGGLRLLKWAPGEAQGGIIEQRLTLGA